MLGYHVGRGLLTIMLGEISWLSCWARSPDRAPCAPAGGRQETLPNGRRKPWPTVGGNLGQQWADTLANSGRRPWPTVGGDLA